MTEADNIPAIFQEAITRVAQGNVGTTMLLIRMWRDSRQYDPAVPFLRYVALLENADVVGPRAYFLWASVCKRSDVRFMTLLAAMRLGLISERHVQAMSLGLQNAEVDLDPLLNLARELHPKLMMEKTNGSQVREERGGDPGSRGQGEHRQGAPVQVGKDQARR